MPRSELRHVVLASDFSPGARRALRRVQHLPLALRAEVVLAHVRRHDSDDALPGLDVTGRLEREAEVLRAALDRWDRGDVLVRSAALRGTPGKVLADFARRISADLVVLGRRGAGGVRRLSLGSTAERVAYLSDAPVLIVARAAPGAYSAPLVALAPDESARVVLAAALRVLSPGTRIRVVGAAFVPLEADLWAGGIPLAETRRVRDRVRERTTATLASELSRRRGGGFDLRLTVAMGDPREVILGVADRSRADLVVVGMGRGSGRRRWPLGRVGAHVLRHARCDVLLVPTTPGNASVNERAGHRRRRARGSPPR